jgi:hypothetical protein
MGNLQRWEAAAGNRAERRATKSLHVGFVSLPVIEGDQDVGFPYVDGRLLARLFWAVL